MNINLNSDKAWGILKTIEKAELKLTLFLLSRNLIKLSSDQEKEMTRLAEYANNKLFTRFIKNDYSDFLKNFESQIDLMANMLNKGKIDSDLVTNLLESVSYFKGVNFECIPDYENNYKRLLLVSLFVESLNCKESLFNHS